MLRGARQRSDDGGEGVVVDLERAAPGPFDGPSIRPETLDVWDLDEGAVHHDTRFREVPTTGRVMAVRCAKVGQRALSSAAIARLISSERIDRSVGIGTCGLAPDPIATSTFPADPRPRFSPSQATENAGRFCVDPGFVWVRPMDAKFSRLRVSSRHCSEHHRCRWECRFGLSV
jgi:hypothetical protein